MLFSCSKASLAPLSAVILHNETLYQKNDQVDTILILKMRMIMMMMMMMMRMIMMMRRKRMITMRIV